MGRIGVTYKDVVEAAATIRNDGENPTVDRVRQSLGTGSKSTIAPFLKRWRSEHQQDADAPQLPDELARAVKNIHGQIQQQADIKINEAQNKFDSAKKELENRIAELTAELDQTIDQNKSLEDACIKLGGQKQSLEKSLDAAHLALSKSNARCEAYESKIDELKLAVNDLNVEKRDIRENFEHFQQATARDRQHERDHFIQLNQQLQDQLKEMNTKLGMAESTVRQHQQQIFEQSRTIEDYSDKNTDLKKNIRAKHEKIKVLLQDIEKMKTQFMESDQQNQVYREKNGILTEELAASKTHLQSLMTMFEKAETRLNEAKQQIDALDAKNTLILQEKAEISGQLKQLTLSAEKDKRPDLRGTTER